MVFSSSIFLFFFLPLAIIGYYIVRKELRIYFLMCASLFFYAWGEPRHILVMLGSITINYVSGLLLHASAERKPFIRKLFLFLAIAGNLGLLFYFKYFNFTLANINRFFGGDFVASRIIMPLGISFFTFQGMSYVIDLYFNKVNVQKNPAIIAFYIMFFPQLIAGPIVRYKDIESQIRDRNESLEKFAEGAKRFVAGLAKKVIIANTLGYTADMIFANPAAGNTPATAWVGVVCYTFQIFFDFSGYSDMAIGLGKMFGFDFLENFNYPYISKTITEFWRRWHISLSTWFRDYLYIPLGGNKRGNVYINLLIVFVVTGFWHGAGFNFIAWGLWHGLFLVIERIPGPREVRKKSLVPLRWCLTMLIVMIGWVFFRANGLREAVKYLGVMFGLIQPESAGFTVWYYVNAKLVATLAIAVILSLPVSKLELFARLRSQTAWWKPASSVLASILFLISAMFVVSSSYNPFIYFRF